MILTSEISKKFLVEKENASRTSFAFLKDVKQPSLRQSARKERKIRDLMAAREQMSKPEELLRPGDVIKDKWRILRMIGKGGFGQIFETEYIKSEEKAAMKAESCNLSRQVNTFQKQRARIFRC